MIKSVNQEEVSNQVSLSVINTDGAAQSGLTAYVYQGTTYSGFSAVTDETGQTAFILPDGDYRFRVDFGGTQFWSEAGSCSVPGCSAVELVVTLPVSVAVVDTDGTPLSGIHVYAFEGDTYKNFNGTTDENGQVSFVLPHGDYRFRADLNGTQFWSGEENTCTLPGCTQAEVIVTKPMTVTVSSESGMPYPDLDVYVFSGTTYSGYHGKTDQSGQVQFTLPVGDYHFRADFNQVQFWSGTENTCTVPGCENDQVTLPGGSGQTQVTIDYEYDALNRLTDVTYSNGTGFHYVYDAVGNVLEYEMVINGQSTFTTYSYDDANQLLTASEGEVTWYYNYDSNGSLIQSTPGETLSAGAKRYSYNTAGFLVSVETYTGTVDWELQAEMLYDGLGNRLEMTGYANGQSVTTRYTLDAGRVLAAASADNSTFYLYGMGLIGELTDNWSYSLPDGSNTARQLTNQTGEVTLVTSYTPWGDLLDMRGEGSFTFGYFGGMMDTATGLMYIGNGQYYDPRTGRFLNHSAKPQQTNPYVPWSGDPAGMFVAPLSLLGLLLGKKKKRGKLELAVVILVLGLSLGMSLTGCSPGTATTEVNTSQYDISVTTTPTPTSDVAFSGKVSSKFQKGNGAPVVSPTLDCFGTLTPTSTSTPTPTPSSPPNIYDYDPTKEPFSIRWNPNSNTPLSPSLPIGGPDAQVNPFVKEINGESISFGGSNLCGQVSLSMIAAKYDYGDILYEIWNNTGETEKATDSMKLLFAAMRTFPGNWQGLSHRFGYLYSLKTSETGSENPKELFNNPEWFYQYGDFPSGYKWYGSDTGDKTASELRARMQMNHDLILISQLEIENGYGTLVPYSTNISHWVVITGMSEQWDPINEDSVWNWVRINNPYNNRVEYYPWNDFKKSMNFGGFEMLELWKQ